MSEQIENSANPEVEKLKNKFEPGTYEQIMKDYPWIKITVAPIQSVQVVLTMGDKSHVIWPRLMRVTIGEVRELLWPPKPINTPEIKPMDLGFGPRNISDQQKDILNSFWIQISTYLDKEGKPWIRLRLPSVIQGVGWDLSRSERSVIQNTIELDSKTSHINVSSPIFVWGRLAIRIIATEKGGRQDFADLIRTDIIQPAQPSPISDYVHNQIQQNPNNFRDIIANWYYTHPDVRVSYFNMHLLPRIRALTIPRPSDPSIGAISFNFAKMNINSYNLDQQGGLNIIIPTDIVRKWTTYFDPNWRGSVMINVSHLWIIQLINRNYP